MKVATLRITGIAVLLLAAAELPAMAATVPVPVPFVFAEGGLPYEAHWGPYIVTVPSQSLVRIAARQGKEADSNRSHILGAAMAYWTSYAELGEEDEVQPWLLSRMPKDMQEEFLHALLEIRKRLAKIPKRITNGR